MLAKAMHFVHVARQDWHGDGRRARSGLRARMRPLPGAAGNLVNVIGW